MALMAWFLLSLQGAWAQTGNAPLPPGQNPAGMHIYIWGGLKSHMPGQHDYPQFLADWSKILTEHGAVVDGALHPPAGADLEHTDVVVIYKGDAAYLSDSEKIALEAYVKRGGGLVSLHDSLCGPDPAYFATLVGGAKKHGEVNYTLDAPIHYAVVDKENPIMKDMSDITIWDEAFFKMTWAKDPGIHVLATAEIPPTHSAGDHKGEVVPQIWTYEHTLPGGSAGSGVRVDAGPHLRQLRQLSGSTDVAPRHRVGREEAGGSARGLRGPSPPPSPRTAFGRWSAITGKSSRDLHSSRKAAIGSTRDARRAGRTIAMAAMPRNNAEIPISTSGSAGRIP